MREKILNIFSARKAPDLSRTAQEKPGPRIWAVGGGKGGVGKSVVSCNLGVLMASTGQRTLLVDGDLGAANLHTMLGAPDARNSLSDFMKGRFDDIRNAITGTGIENLDLVSGSRDSSDAPSTGERQVERLVQAIKGLDYGLVIIDCAPGTGTPVLDLFLASTEGILVMTPEQTSVENLYRFIKCLLLRKVRAMHATDGTGRLKGLLERVFNRTSGKPRTIKGLIDEVKAADAEQGHILGGHLQSTRLFTVINQTFEAADANAGRAVERACYDYFRLNVPCLGHIPFDHIVRESVKTGKPLVRGFASTEAAACMEGVFSALGKNTRDAAAI